MTRTLAALLLLAAGTPALQGYADVLPADTVAYLGLDDVDGFRAELRASAWGGLLEEPEMAPWRELIDALVEKLSEGSYEATGIDVTEIVDLVHGPAALALVDLGDLDDPDGPARPVFAAVLDPGEDLDALLDAVDRLVEGAGESGEVVLQYEEVEGFGMSIVADVEADGRPVELRYGTAGGAFVLAGGAEEGGVAEAWLDLAFALDGDAGAVLADAPAFTASSAAGGEDAMRMFVDAGAIFDFAASMAERDGGDDAALSFVTVMRNLGLDALGALAQRAETTGDGSSTVGELRWDPDSVLAEMMTAVFRAGPARLAGLMPPELFQMWSVQVDPLGGFDTIVRLVGRIEPSWTREVIGLLAAFDQEFGYDLRDDVIASFGDEVGFFTAEVPPSEAIPGSDPPMAAAVVFDLEDGTGLRTFVDALLREFALHAARQRHEFLGYELFHVPLGFGFALNYAILDDLLVLSNSDTLARDVLRRKSGGDLPSIASELGLPDDATAIAWADGAMQARSVMGGVSGALAGAIGGGADLGDLDPSRLVLPSLDVLRRHFDAPAVTITRVTEDGVFSESTGP